MHSRARALRVKSPAGLAGEDVVEHVAADIGEAEVASAETIGELFVVQTEKMQNGRVQVIDVHLVLDSLVAEGICASVMHAAAHAAACHPDGKSVGVVVAAKGAL